MKSYPETHQRGAISIENLPEEFGLRFGPDGKTYMEGDFSIQIAEDGGVWVDVNGVTFLRFKPM